MAGNAIYHHGYHELTGISYPYSNAADMLFLDTDPLVPGDNEFHLTVAREFQHLVNFNKTYIEGEGRQFDTWINEGLSSAAEYLYQGSHVGSKINYYKADPYWDISFGVNFVTWDPDYAVDPFSSYSTVYLFFQWLRIQADNGSGIYSDIINSSSMDYRAVAGAASLRGIGTTWAGLLRDWFIANLFNQADGLYGYQGELSLIPWVWAPGLGELGDSWPLAPGEGVYVGFADPYTPVEKAYLSRSGLDPGGEGFLFR